MRFAANTLFLWVSGDNIQDRSGHLQYLLFYLAAGVAAIWLQIATNTMSQIPMIGASEAIAGVLGAYLLLFPYNRIRTAVVFFITFVRIPAVYLFGFWFLLLTQMAPRPGERRQSGKHYKLGKSTTGN